MELIYMNLDTPELMEIRARNEIRVAEAKAALGTKWVLHPSNSPKKQPRKRVTCKKR